MCEGHFHIFCPQLRWGGGGRTTDTPVQNIKSTRAARVERAYTLSVISLPQTLTPAFAFVSVIVGDYFNREKGSW